MIKCSVFIATSLDGFISREDGSIDWLNEANNLVTNAEDLGFERFISTVDAIVMGRNTFEQVIGFEQWPYKHIPLIVLSRHLNALPPTAPASVSISSENPQQLVKRLAENGCKHIYVDGGQTIHSFLQDHLINEITITQIPVLIGSGKTLFGALQNDLHLEHIHTSVFHYGFVQSKYRIVASNPS